MVAGAVSICWLLLLMWAAYKGFQQSLCCVLSPMEQSVYSNTFTKIKWRRVFFGTVILLILMAVLSSIVRLIMPTVVLTHNTELMTSMREFTISSGVNSFFSLIAAPVVESYLYFAWMPVTIYWWFHSLIQDNLMSKSTVLTIAAWFSSFCFIISHVSVTVSFQNLIAETVLYLLLPTFFFWYLTKTKSIKELILVHSLYNLCVIFIGLAGDML